jgi:hypothetical protein
MSRPNIDLRSRLSGGARDQGVRPTCLAFAISSAHEAERYTDTTPFQHLSPESIWQHAKAGGFTDSTGLSAPAAQAALVDEGQPLLSDWSYSAPVATDRPATLIDPPWNRAAMEPIALLRDEDEQPLEDALAASRIIVLQVPVTGQFDWPDRSGIIWYEPNAVSRGLHAVAVVGAANIANVGRCFLIQNSWGAGWAMSGYAWAHVSFVSNAAVAVHRIVVL